jgi:hypothetical protein
MKVFISWSGLQRKHIAHALRIWLRLVIQHIDPWMSELDIGAGQRWGNELWKELQDSQFGVVCLTAENLQAPWMHFETGALAKAVDQRVCPYLYEIQPGIVQGPLSQFQMKKTDKTGTRELLQSINDASTSLHEKALPIEDLNEAFETWWPKLEAKLNTVPPTATTVPPRREAVDMLEELLELVRNLARSSPSRDDLLELVRTIGRSSPSRDDPVLEFVRNLARSSPFRDELLELVRTIGKSSPSRDDLLEALGKPSRSAHSGGYGRSATSEPILPPNEPQEGAPPPK